jgi:AraC-like DNA-binding protein
VIDHDQLRRYIDRHLAGGLTVRRLARLARLSPYHFIRAFRAATGLTPHQYVRRRRLERAMDLLVTTPRPVTEICDAVGFRSLGSFSSLFRRVTGETPRAYRAARRRQPYIPSCFLRMYRAEPPTAISKKRKYTRTV